MQNANIFAYVKKKSYLCAKIAQTNKNKYSSTLRGLIIGQLRQKK